MHNFDFLEKGLGIVSPPDFVYDFSRKLFLMLCSIKWPFFLPDCLYFLRYLSICVLQLFSNQVVMWSILKITLSFYSGKMLKIYLDHKFLWSQKGFICEGNQVTLQPSGLGNFFVCKKFEVQTFLWSLEFVFQVSLEHDTITV